MKEKRWGNIVINQFVSDIWSSGVEFSRFKVFGKSLCFNVQCKFWFLIDNYRYLLIWFKVSMSEYQKESMISFHWHIGYQSLLYFWYQYYEMNAIFDFLIQIRVLFFVKKGMLHFHDVAIPGCTFIETCNLTTKQDSKIILQHNSHWRLMWKYSCIFTFFYVHKKKILDSRKFSTSDFR